MHPFATPSQALVMLGFGLLIAGLRKDHYPPGIGGFPLPMLASLLVGSWLENPDAALFCVCRPRLCSGCNLAKDLFAGGFGADCRLCRHDRTGLHTRRGTNAGEDHNDDLHFCGCKCRIPLCCRCCDFFEKPLLPIIGFHGVARGFGLALRYRARDAGATVRFGRRAAVILLSRPTGSIQRLSVITTAHGRSGPYRTCRLVARHDQVCTFFPVHDDRRIRMPRVHPWHHAGV